MSHLPRYNDALTHLKSNPDPVWHASVLEGLSTVGILEAWASSGGLVSPSCSKKPGVLTNQPVGIYISQQSS